MANNMSKLYAKLWNCVLVQDVSYSVKLKAIDRYFMGLHLFGKEHYYQSGFWLYSAIDSYEPSEYNRIVDFGEEKSFSLYAEALLKQSKCWKVSSANR